MHMRGMRLKDNCSTVKRVLCVMRCLLPAWYRTFGTWKAPLTSCLRSPHSGCHLFCSSAMSTPSGHWDGSVAASQRSPWQSNVCWLPASDQKRIHFSRPEKPANTSLVLALHISLLHMRLFLIRMCKFFDFVRTCEPRVALDPHKASQRLMAALLVLGPMDQGVQPLRVKGSARHHTSPSCYLLSPASFFCIVSSAQL